MEGAEGQGQGGRGQEQGGGVEGGEVGEGAGGAGEQAQQLSGLVLGRERLLRLLKMKKRKNFWPDIYMHEVQEKHFDPSIPLGYRSDPP